MVIEKSDNSHPTFLSIAVRSSACWIPCKIFSASSSSWGVLALPLAPRAVLARRQTHQTQRHHRLAAWHSWHYLRRHPRLHALHGLDQLRRRGPERRRRSQRSCQRLPSCRRPSGGSARADSSRPHAPTPMPSSPGTGPPWPATTPASSSKPLSIRSSGVSSCRSRPPRPPNSPQRTTHSTAQRTRGTSPHASTAKRIPATRDPLVRPDRRWHRHDPVGAILERRTPDCTPSRSSFFSLLRTRTSRYRRH